MSPLIYEVYCVVWHPAVLSHPPTNLLLFPQSKERAATAIADNSDTARKIKDTFRSKMATFIVSVLNPYRRGDCREGKITCTEDFKYLARKVRREGDERFRGRCFRHLDRRSVCRGLLGKDHRRNIYTRRYSYTKIR